MTVLVVIVVVAVVVTAHGLLFPISSKVLFYIIHPTNRIAHTTAFVIPVLAHWVECEIAQWVHHEGSIRLV